MFTVQGIKLYPQAAASESLDWKDFQAAALAVNFYSNITHLCLIKFAYTRKYSLRALAPQVLIKLV